jgi:diguanylate cyclase (GGDEF)-like protein
MGAASSAPPTLDRLLARLRPRPVRPLSRRELVMEAVSSGLLVVVVAAMALGFGSAHASGHTPSPLDVAGLILLHAALSHVRLYIGGGYGVPTVLALVPMLFVLPPAAVPAAVAAGGLVATGLDLLRGRARADRLLVAVGDAWRAVGPALVFAVAGAPGPTTAHWMVLVPALAAHLAADTIGSVLRRRFGRGRGAGEQLRLMGWVVGLDLLMAPVAYLAVIAPVPEHRGWLLLAPVVVVLAGLVLDRRLRIEEETARTASLRRERARLQAVLRQVGGALASNLDGDAMLAAVRETAREALDASAAFAGEPSADTGPITSAAVDLLARAAGVAGTDSGTAVVEAGGWHALACRMGRSDSREVLGVARRDRPFDPEEVEILHHLAAHAAVSLENARLHARVREQASVDELTGLANHRTLQRVLLEQLAGGERFAPRLSLVLLDIDDFKRVNDTYGHLVGDRVLRAVADAIRSRCRTVDQPARYGGEELAVALPRTDAAGALRMAEDLRRAVEDLRIDVPGADALRITVSAGVATAPDSGSTPSELVAAADRALYSAKRAGKNRTVAARAAEPVA